MSEDTIDPQKALREIAKMAPLYAKAKAELVYVEEYRKTVKALAMREACRHTSSPKNNPGAALGGMMAAMARAGRDKVTLLTSPALASFGLWVEQLLECLA